MLASRTVLDVPRVALYLDSTRPCGATVQMLELGEALHERGAVVTLHALDDSGNGFFRQPRCPNVLVPIGGARPGMLVDLGLRLAAYEEFFEGVAPDFEVYHAADVAAGAALARLVQRGRIPNFARTIRYLDVFTNLDVVRPQDLSVTAASQVFVASRLMQRRVEKTYGVHAALVQNGVDAQRFHAVSREWRAGLRRELGFATAPLFVSIGAIEPRSNILAILEAFAIVRTKYTFATLVIAAAGSFGNHPAYEAAFEARADALGLRIGHDIRVLATLPDAAIVRLLQAASALVSPSLVEGFGLVVLEALACETPVIASRIAPLTEYLAPNEALLVDPNDPFDIAEAMLNALEPAVATVLAVNGRESVRDRTWDACARAHLAHYRSLLAGRRAVERV